MADAPVIVWFRNDLRLDDHRALHAAVALKRPIAPVFILDDAAPGNWARGGASRWWLGESLSSLAADLERRGSRLILRRGQTGGVLQALAREAGADTIYATRAYEPWAARLEVDVKADCDRAGIAFKRTTGALLFEPEALRTKPVTRSRSTRRSGVRRTPDQRRLNLARLRRKSRRRHAGLDRTRWRIGR